MPRFPSVLFASSALLASSVTVSGSSSGDAADQSLATLLLRKLDEQNELMRQQMQRIAALEQSVGAAVLPEIEPRILEADTATRSSGIRINANRSFITFGTEHDVVVARTEQGGLDVQANVLGVSDLLALNIDLDPDDPSSWNETAPGLTIGGVSLYDYVRQIAYDTCTETVAKTYRVDDTGCTWRKLYQEDTADGQGFLDAGLGALADDAAWHEGQIIKFEWTELDGFHEVLEFITESDPFVDRSGTNSGAKSDNQLFAFSNFTTTHEDLSELLTDGGGGYLCLGNAGGWDTAWAVIPQDNAYWGIGCNSGGWTGTGAYYGEAYRWAGWVGFKTSGATKSAESLSMDFSVHVCDLDSRR